MLLNSIAEVCGCECGLVGHMRGRGFFAQNLSTASFNHATTGKGAEKVYCPGILFYLIRDVMMLTQGTKAWGIFSPFQAYDR